MLFSSTEELKPVDLFFAKTLAKDASEEVAYFLANALRAAREGHLCVPAPDFPLPAHLFEKSLHKEGEWIYLQRNWECEKQFFMHYRRLLSSAPAVEIPRPNITEGLEPEQKEAIYHAAKNALSLICGGPGTGKTFTATTLIRHFLPHVDEVVVAAPTGKATANLRRPLEGLCEVKTLHALLKKGEITADVILIDEASMIDAELMSQLFASVRQGARLILIGDRDQLPPVESGNFFADLASQNALVTTLGKCLRAELQEIVDLARAVKQGASVPSQPLPDLAVLEEAVLDRGACVLTPLKGGPYGVRRLNKHLHEMHVKRGGSRFPIMVRTNDAAADLYNGDVGELLPAERSAYFQGRTIPEYLLPHYDFAYVISVHKSQGSEYDEVIVLLPEGSEKFGQEMLYTAITRAKKRVTIYAKEGILPEIVGKKERRLSGFTRAQPHPTFEISS